MIFSFMLLFSANHSSVWAKIGSRQGIYSQVFVSHGPGTQVGNVINRAVSSEKEIL